MPSSTGNVFPVAATLRSVPVLLNTRVSNRIGRDGPNESQQVHQM
jgi:hypothetical protein